jgi:hypothetical protein
MRSYWRATRLRCVLACVAFLLLLPLHLGLDQSWHYASVNAQNAPASEKDAFEAAKELGTVEAWDAFLSNYPTGFHADLARAYVKKLGDPATPPPAGESTPLPSDSVSGEPSQERPCADARKLKSQRSDKPAKIRFVNESDGTIILQWIDFSGALKEYGEVPPGAQLTQDTFITHPWIAAYQEGSCRQLFMPGDGLTIARILPEEELPRATPSAKTPQPKKPTTESRAKAACVDIGMIYLNGKCAPKKKSERERAGKSKNKACPAGMYRNPYGQCQPNETGG